MLDTLLESRSRPRRNSIGAAVSAVVHGTLIIAAAYATASGSQPDLPANRATKIHWIPNTAPADRADAPASRPAAAATPRPAIRPPSIQIDVAAPSVSIDFGDSRALTTDFAPGPTVNFDSAAHRGAQPSNYGDKRPFDAAEVDLPAAAIASTVRPEYPGALRSSGVEGQVIAQFVVDQSGRAQSSTARILSATNDLFAESVRRALPKMRFIPAKVAGRPVPQMVQQAFVFRLDR